MYEVVHKRKILILGDNFPEDSRSIASNFCCALKLKQGDSELVKELNDDTAESLLKKSDKCMWYDEKWRSRGEKEDPINGLDSNCQAYRQTMLIAQGMYPVPLTNPQGPQGTDVRKIPDRARPFDPDTKNILCPIDTILCPHDVILCPNDCDVIPSVTHLHARQQKIDVKFFKVRHI